MPATADAIAVTISTLEARAAVLEQVPERHQHDDPRRVAELGHGHHDRGGAVRHVERLRDQIQQWLRIEDVGDRHAGRSGEDEGQRAEPPRTDARIHRGRLA